jgi:predicted metal-dependent HD superfamily phosphohydrolase
MFNVAREEGISLNNEEIMAIWLHDIIYVPGDRHNKFRSAIFATDYINSQPQFSRRDKRVNANIVSDIILDTVAHVPRAKSGSMMVSKQVIDLDLWILSETEKVYKAYVSLVSEEFIPLLGVDDFIQKRAEWIDSMQWRDSIYVSKHTPLYVERRARRNLRLEQEAMNDPEKYRTEFLGMERKANE